MLSQNDNSLPVIARAIRLLGEMPYPYPAFGDMLRVFAALDYSMDEDELHTIVANYLRAILKNKDNSAQYYVMKKPRPL